MSNSTLEKGVCDNHKSKINQFFSALCSMQIFWPPNVCILKKITLVTKIKVYINLPKTFVKQKSIRHFIEWTEENKIEHKYNIQWKRYNDPDRRIGFMWWWKYFIKQGEVVSYLVLEPNLAMRYPIMVGIWHIFNVRKTTYAS